MSEPVKADHEAILQGLRDNCAAFKDEFERHETAIADLRAQLHDLLACGKAQGVALRAMSKAAQINRPTLNRIFGELAAEREDR